jgi:hypothetical protein
MAFAQLTYRESLRDIETCLQSIGSKLYHMGFRSKVARSTLADANESRDWRIYADFAQVLIAIARPLYVSDPIGVELDQGLYALDSTTIDLCLSLLPCRPAAYASSPPLCVGEIWPKETARGKRSMVVESKAYRPWSSSHDRIADIERARDSDPRLRKVSIGSASRVIRWLSARVDRATLTSLKPHVVELTGRIDVHVRCREDSSILSCAKAIEETGLGRKSFVPCGRRGSG